MNHTEKDIETITSASVRRANDCFVGGRIFEFPVPLFGEFWREGELALFFGASGTGKSVLAMQLADELARGQRLIGPGRPKPSGRKVLYVDLELTDTQFQARYFYFPDDGDDLLSYEFSAKLYRDRPRGNEELIGWLRAAVVESGFEVIIIDSLSAVKSTHDGTRETLSLMRRLRALRDELQIAILALADASEPLRNRTVGEGDLGRSRVLCTVADSVFAIGQRRGDDRYIIQTRSRGSWLSLTAENALLCRLVYPVHGPLRFEFEDRFAPVVAAGPRRQILAVKALRNAGRSFREIGHKLNISKTQAARLFYMWTPELEDAEETGLAESG